MSGINPQQNRVAQNWDNLSTKEKIGGVVGQTTALGAIIGGAVLIAKIALPLLAAAGAFTAAAHPAGWVALVCGIALLGGGVVATAYLSHKLLKAPQVKPQSKIQPGFLSKIGKGLTNGAKKIFYPVMHPLRSLRIARQQVRRHPALTGTLGVAALTGAAASGLLGQAAQTLASTLASNGLSLLRQGVQMIPYIGQYVK